MTEITMKLKKTKISLEQKKKNLPNDLETLKKKKTKITIKPKK